MGPGIKGSSTQPRVEHRKLTPYCLVSSSQVSVICRMWVFFFFSSSPSLKGMLEMASFLRDDKVNPIWSSSWRKWHLKLVLCLSSKPVSSLFTEYFWMETEYEIPGLYRWIETTSVKILEIRQELQMEQNFLIFCFYKHTGRSKQRVGVGRTQSDLMGCSKVKDLRMLWAEREHRPEEIA